MKILLVLKYPDATSSSVYVSNVTYADDMLLLSNSQIACEIGALFIDQYAEWSGMSVKMADATKHAGRPQAAVCKNRCYCYNG
jgi:hypothetical protein